MGLFKRQPKEPEDWTLEVEAFSNYAVELKYATDRIIDAAVDNDERLVGMIWENMTTEQRQYGFWFMLGMVASMIQRERDNDSPW